MTLGILSIYLLHITLCKMEDKKCIECANSFYGRSDKKFCSDSCRNAYNNRMIAPSTATIKRINRVLRKNYQILNAMTPEQKPTVSVARLSAKGFDFDHFTSLLETKEGRQYRFCYDIGYLLLNPNLALVVRKKD